MNGLSSGQNSLDDFHARIVAVRMDGDKAAAGAERARQRSDHPLGFEFERGARAIGLRGDDEIVIGDRAAGSWDQRVEQETVVLAIDDEHHRALVDRVAGARADAGFPVLHQKRLEIDDLLLEAMRGISGQRQFVPDQTRRRVERLDREPRRVGISEIGQAPKPLPDARRSGPTFFVK